MRPKRVLLIDDSAAEHFICKHTIEKYDQSIEVLDAYDGVESLELLATIESPPDIMLVDLNMPRMNGVEFLKTYCKTHRSDKTKVAIFTSSATDRYLVEEGSDCCARLYIEKPLDREKLDMLCMLDGDSEV